MSNENIHDKSNLQTRVQNKQNHLLPLLLLWLVFSNVRGSNRPGRQE